MTISEKKMQIVIDNYFKSECDVNTSIRQAFEKGFRIGVKKVSSAQPEHKELQDWKTDFKGFIDDLLYMPRDDYRGIMEYIDEVPSALPERKTGEWLHVDINFESESDGTLKGWMPWYCSECGYGVGKHQTTFCPNCGADMRGEQE